MITIIILLIVCLGCYLVPFLCLRHKWNIMLHAISAGLAAVSFACLFSINSTGYSKYNEMLSMLCGYGILLSSVGIHWNYLLATKLKTAKRSLLVASILFDLPFLFLFFIMYHNPEGPPKEDMGLMTACWIYLFLGAIVPLATAFALPGFSRNAK